MSNSFAPAAGAPAPGVPLPSAGGIDFAAAFRAAPVAMLILDRDLRYVACNEATADINGIPVEAHIGRTVRELLPELAGLVEPRFRAVFATGLGAKGVRVVGSTPRAPGVERVWLESISPLPDASGRLAHILVTVQEITALAAAEASVRDSEQKFRVAQQLSTDGFAILRARRDAQDRVEDFVWEYANPAAEAAAGVGPLAGRSLLETAPGGRGHPGLFPRYVDLLDQGGSDEVELELTVDGVTRLYRNAAVALDRDRLAVAVQDLSDHLRKEEQLRLITDEFRHRVKNVITIALGLLAQTARSAADAPSLRRALEARLQALAVSQDLLMPGGGAVSLPELVAAALRPFDSDRLRQVPGPPVSVPGAAVSPLTLALNELATNALKYGALSREGGLVEVAWTRAGGRVVLGWSESGGPPVGPPRREGLGTRLLADAAAHLPAGALQRDFAPAGLRVTLAWDD